MNHEGIKVVAALLCLLLAGCALNQAREVQTYRNVLDENTTKAAAGVYTPKSPIRLKDALRLANANNEQLAISGENYLQALINKDRAFSSFLPVIAFTPTYMQQEKTSIDASNPLIRQFEPESARDLQLQGSANLSPFQDVPAVWSASAEARRQKALLKDRREVVLLDVAQTYYQIMHAEQQAQVLKHSVELQDQSLKDMQLRFQAGTVAPLDVAQTEAQLAGTRTSRIQADNDVRNGRAMLAMLTGVPSVEGALTGGFAAPAVHPDISSLMTLAEAHRPDLLAAREQVAAAASRLEAAWGRYFPSVSLNLTRYLSRETFPSDSDWTSLIQVHIPIFTAGLVYEDVRTAYSQLRQAHLVESWVQKQILKDIRTTLEDFTDAQKRLHERDIQVKAGKEALNHAESAYKAGVGTNLDRIAAQDVLLKAELGRTDEQFNLDIAYLRLLRFTGVMTPDLKETLKGQAD